MFALGICLNASIGIYIFLLSPISVMLQINHKHIILANFPCFQLRIPSPLKGGMHLLDLLAWTDLSSKAAAVLLINASLL